MLETLYVVSLIFYHYEDSTFIVKVASSTKSKIWKSSLHFPVQLGSVMGSLVAQCNTLAGNNVSIPHILLEASYVYILTIYVSLLPFFNEMDSYHIGSSAAGFYSHMKRYYFGLLSLEVILI